MRTCNLVIADFSGGVCEGHVGKMLQEEDRKSASYKREEVWRRKSVVEVEVEDVEEAERKKAFAQY